MVGVNMIFLKFHIQDIEGLNTIMAVVIWGIGNNRHPIWKIYGLKYGAKLKNSITLFRIKIFYNLSGKLNIILKYQRKCRRKNKFFFDAYKTTLYVSDSEYENVDNLFMKNFGFIF